MFSLPCNSCVNRMSLSLYSKSTLTLATTTWLKPRWRTSSCPRRRQRRRRARGTTSPPCRTCHRGNLLWWLVNWQADARQPLQHPLALWPLLFLLQSQSCNITSPLPPPPPHTLNTQRTGWFLNPFIFGPPLPPISLLLSLSSNFSHVYFISFSKFSSLQHEIHWETLKCDERRRRTCETQTTETPEREGWLEGFSMGII